MVMSLDGGTLPSKISSAVCIASALRPGVFTSTTPDAPGSLISDTKLPLKFAQLCGTRGRFAALKARIVAVQYEGPNTASTWGLAARQLDTPCSMGPSAYCPSNSHTILM